MAFNTSDDTDRNSAAEAENEFYVRAFAAWVLLLLPGLFLALVFSQWLLYLVVVPIIAAPCTIWIYDLLQLLRLLRKRSNKFLLVTLSGFSLTLLGAAIATQVYVDLSDSFPASVAKRSTTISEYAQESSVDVHSLLQPNAALKQAKELGMQASIIVQSPPHPLSTWELADQKWTQAIQHLESIPPKTEAYEEAVVKLADYQANQRMIAERIKAEQKASDSYEKGKRIVSELIELSKSVESYRDIDIITLQHMDKKLEVAVQAFSSIPSGTATFEKAQANSNVHKDSHQTIQSMIATLRDCHEMLPCNIAESQWLIFVRDFEKIR